MKGAGYLSAAVLACVFAWAGSSKLRHGDRAADAFRAMGLPAPMKLGRAVALVELTLALLLLTTPFMGGLLALIVLAAFTIVLGRTIRSGEGVQCGCFGTSRQKPVSWVELVRNLLLAMLAAGATFATSPVAPSIPEAVLVTSAVAAGAMIVALCDLRREAGAVWDNRRAWERADQR
ncbi:MAG: MauE/DoxX family redox-associated membrane protein [Actinomycetota bacterium]